MRTIADVFIIESLSFDDELKSRHEGEGALIVLFGSSIAPLATAS